MKNKSTILNSLAVLLVISGLLEACSNREELVKKVADQPEESTKLEPKKERLRNDRGQNEQKNLKEYFRDREIEYQQGYAKDIVRLFNRSQVGYYPVKASFADSFDKLIIGKLRGSLTDRIENYIYQMTPGTDITSITATSTDSTLKSYAGATIRYVNEAQQSVMSSVICESNEPTTTPIQIIPREGKPPECPPGSTSVDLSK